MGGFLPQKKATLRLFQKKGRKKEIFFFFLFFLKFSFPFVVLSGIKKTPLFWGIL